MTRGEAITRIVQMQALVARDSTPEHEKTVAQEMIVRLKAQHSLTDREIERRRHIEEAGGADARGIFGGGNKLWFYELRIKPHVDVIQSELEQALAVIATQDLSNRVELLCELTDALRAMADANSKDAWSRVPNVQRERNQAIKEAYTTEKERLSKEGYYGFPVDDPIKLHEYAVNAVKDMAGYKTGLTTATVESLVRISTKKLLEEQWRKWQEEEQNEQDADG